MRATKDIEIESSVKILKIRENSKDQKEIPPQLSEGKAGSLNNEM